MYRTDKQFMTNPATANSRIYIGGIPKTVVASDLEEKFKVHGKILGLVLQSGFAFIQYENEGQAQAAIRNEVNAMLHGRKITVKQALDKSKNTNNQQRGRQNQIPNQNFNQNKNFIQNQGPPFMKEPQNQQQQQKMQFQPPPQQQQPVPLMQQPIPPPAMHPEPANEPQPSPQQSPQQKQNQPSPQQQQQQHQFNFNQQLQHDQPQQQQPPPQLQPNRDREPHKNEGPPEKRARKRRVRSKERFQGSKDRFNRDDNYYGMDDYAAPRGPFNRTTVPPVIVDQPDRNDCEIIVVSKLLTKYAEYIEQRLKSAGLIVDLLFPNEDVPIGRVLANISSRGCLYAILIMPQNEEHRSLTLNILHGVPQEHRNMPIEDAMILITRNFDAYMRGDRSATETLGPGGVMNISDRHPTSMQLLLNLLAENRQITSAQYDRILKYLQERKDLQVQHEITEGVDQTSQESSGKQAELQSRIMSILNNKTNEIPAAPLIEEAPAEDVAPPLLKDPSVQKALDSLIGGDMFKNMTGGF